MPESEADERSPEASLHTTNSLIPVVYEELRRLATSQLRRANSGQSISGTILIHETYLRLQGQDSKWSDERHFFRVAAEAMRRVYIDYLRAKGRIKRGGNFDRSDESLSSFASPARDDQLLAIDSALEELEREDPESADLVKLRFFVGMTLEEIASSTGVSRRTITRQWKYVRVWLTQHLKEDFG